MDKKTELKKYAEEIGFPLFGVAESHALDDEFSHFEEWLNNGYQGRMSFLQRNTHKRQNPSNILVNAKSVIMTAINYFVPKDFEQKGNNYGKISRYAWGDDYHDVIQTKLKLLIEKIEILFPESESISYVDSGPVMEKQWAQYAGIGWQGKNGVILTKEFGSWIFLGTIITSAEIEPDTPAKDHCGTCTKCIDACPTKAIIKPKVLDAQRCLAYWNLETKVNQEIPEFIIRNSDNRLYGCDICQEVCPWNKFQKPTTEERFSPDKIINTLSINELNQMTEEVFHELFAKKAVNRIGLQKLKRNAAFISESQAGHTAP